MRRHLEPMLAFSAAAYLALGCAGLGSADAAGVGGVGPEGATSGTGTYGSVTGAGAGGGGSTASESSDTAPAVDPKADLTSCLVTSELSLPTFLSIPRARSMVSASQVRGELAGTMPTIPVPSTIRAPELLNYYHLDYPSTSVTELTVVPELQFTGIKGQMLLQIGIQAPPSDSAHRRPTSVTVLVDTSKSMEGESLKRANAAVLAVSRSLNAGDVLNVVTTNPEVAPIHRVAAIAADPALFSEKTPLMVSGAGDVGAALARAYAAATDGDSYLAGGLNRVVVITDGGGLPESIDNRLVNDSWVTQGIALVGVGVGLAQSYNPALLDYATGAGHGANLYLDSPAEAEAQLHLRFDEVMDEALHDVSIGFQLPTIFEVVNPSAVGGVVGEAELARSDLGSGRSMVFRHAVSLCPTADSMALVKTSMTVTVSWNDPALPERQSKAFTFGLDMVGGQKPSYAFRKASAIIAFTNALQSLQASRFQAACDKVAEVHNAFLSHPADPELDSIAAQISAHPVAVKNMVTCP
jgi:Ca-activated chloride channel family protein